MKGSISWLPVGFRFNPTDEEIVKHYLKGDAILPCSHIKYCDIYGDKSPWEIFQTVYEYDDDDDEDDENVFYVYSKLKKASPGRISRVAGCGTWHLQKSTTEIYEEGQNNNVVIGLRKTFSFKAKEGLGLGLGLGSNKRSQGHWIMHEYSLVGEKRSGHDDYVLCRIIKKIGKEEAEAESSIGNIVTDNYFMESDNLMFLDNPMNQFELGYGLAFGAEEVGDNLMLHDTPMNQFELGYGLSLGFDAHEVDSSFAMNNKDDVMFDDLEPILQFDTQERNLSMLEKYLMDDNFDVKESWVSSSLVDYANMQRCTNEPQQPALLQESEVDEFIEELISHDYIFCNNKH